MTVYFNKLPKKKTDVVIFCNLEKKLPIECKILDVRDLIQNSIDEFTDNLIQYNRLLIRALKENIFRWNFSPVSRLLVWPNGPGGYSVKNIYMAQAVDKFARDNTKDIYVLGAENYVSLYVSQLAGDAYQVCIIDQRSLPNRRFSYFLRLFRSVAAALRAYFQSILRRQSNQQSSVGENFIFSTVFKSNSDTYLDHFFGNLFDSQRNESLKITWVFDNLNIQLAKNQLKNSNRNECEPIDFLFSKISFTDILKAIYLDLLQHIKFRAFFRDCNLKFFARGGESRAIADDFFLDLGIRQTSFTQFLTYFLVRRLINVYKPKTLIYPYEGKLNEAALLSAIRDSNENVKTVGFAHAAYTKGHMFTQFFDLIPENIPSIMAVTGKRSANFFVKNGIHKSKVTVVGTGRFHERDQGPHSYFRLKQKRKLRVLFISSLGFEYLNFAKILVQYPEICKQFDVRIRASYHSWHKERLLGDSLLSQSSGVVRKSNGDLRQEILSSDVILFEYTTAAYQASLLGRLILKLKVFETFSTDHISPEKHKVPYFEECVHESQIFNVLRDISELDLGAYNSLVLAQRKVIGEIYEAPHHHQIRELFSQS